MKINDYLDNTNIAELLDMKQYFFMKIESDKKVDNLITNFLENKMQDLFITSFSVLIDNSLSKIIDLNNNITILDTSNAISLYDVKIILNKKNVIFVNDVIQDSYIIDIKKGDRFRLKNDSIYFLYLLAFYNLDSNLSESSFNDIKIIDKNNNVSNLNIKYNYSHLKISVPQDIIDKEIFKFSLSGNEIKPPSTQKEDEFDLITNKEKFHFLNINNVKSTSALYETSIILSSENEKFNSNKLQFFNDVYIKELNKKITLVDSNARENYFNLFINDIWIDDDSPSKTTIFFKIIIPESETVYLQHDNDYRIYNGKNFYSIEIDNKFMVSFD